MDFQSVKGGQSASINQNHKTGKFEIADDVTTELCTLDDLERKLFGLVRVKNQDQEITDISFIPVKT